MDFDRCLTEAITPIPQTTKMLAPVVARSLSVCKYLCKH
jgi:hypothetical protein